MSRPAQTETICAIATPLGKGGLGIIRFSGPDALSIAGRCILLQKRPASPGRTRSEAGLDHLESHRVHHGWFVDPSTQEPIDEILITPMRAPRSYTREDVVEISGHGGPATLARMLEGCLTAGARLAAPGEFTKRAFLNGRLDLTQAEAVMALIHAESEAAHRLALRQLQGDVAVAIRSLREALLALLADCEAMLDFVEDGLTFSPMEQLRARLDHGRIRVAELLQSHRTGQLLCDGVRTIIIGRPNVGKSSLFNRLLHRDRAIVTPYPGTTRDLIEETMTIDGLPLRLMDTAGLRDSPDPIEQEGIQRARRSWEEADLVLMVLDGSQPLQPDDWSLITQLKNDNTIIVFNKIDISYPVDSATVISRFPTIPTIQISATQGIGCDQLKEAISRRLFEKAGDPSNRVIISQARHRQALQAAVESLDRAASAAQSGLSPEFIASDLHEAVHQLGSILGVKEAISDELLDQIFSRFCIGK
jgi:tRNA modification GTPase